jgi:hypothetical protein
MGFNVGMGLLIAKKSNIPVPPYAKFSKKIIIPARLP